MVVVPVVVVLVAPVTGLQTISVLDRALAGYVHGAPAGALRDLLTATEAIRHDKCAMIRSAHGGQQYALSQSLRDAVFVALEAERAGHAAAAGLNGLNDSAGVAEKLVPSSGVVSC